MKKALEIQEATLDLARKSGTEQDHLQLVGNLQKTANEIMGQLKKLEDGIFCIGVVGVENTGKSSIINAWVDEDILPNDSDRCTLGSADIEE